MPAKPTSTSGAWTEEEDQLLAHWQSIVGNKWSEIAPHIKGKTGQQCAQRWRHRVNPNICRSRWTPEEDARLAALVEQFGNSWAEIARQLDGRTDQQCMGRWRRRLDPSIKQGSWGKDEDALLRELVATFGNSWKDISQRMKNRTGTQCRARWLLIDGDMPTSGPHGVVTNRHNNANNYEEEEEDSDMYDDDDEDGDTLRKVLKGKTKPSSKGGAAAAAIEKPTAPTTKKDSTSNIKGRKKRPRPSGKTKKRYAHVNEEEEDGDAYYYVTGADEDEEISDIDDDEHEYVPSPAVKKAARALTARGDTTNTAAVPVAASGGVKSKQLTSKAVAVTSSSPPAPVPGRRQRKGAPVSAALDVDVVRPFEEEPLPSPHQQQYKSINSARKGNRRKPGKNTNRTTAARIGTATATQSLLNDTNHQQQQQQYVTDSAPAGPPFFPSLPSPEGMGRSGVVEGSLPCTVEVVLPLDLHRQLQELAHDEEKTTKTIQKFTLDTAHAATATTTTTGRVMTDSKQEANGAGHNNTAAVYRYGESSEQGQRQDNAERQEQIPLKSSDTEFASADEGMEFVSEQQQEQEQQAGNATTTVVEVYSSEDASQRQATKLQTSSTILKSEHTLEAPFAATIATVMHTDKVAVVGSSSHQEPQDCSAPPPTLVNPRSDAQQQQSQPLLSNDRQPSEEQHPPTSQQQQQWRRSQPAPILEEEKPKQSQKEQQIKEEAAAAAATVPRASSSYDAMRRISLCLDIPEHPTSTPQYFNIPSGHGGEPSSLVPSSGPETRIGAGTAGTTGQIPFDARLTDGIGATVAHGGRKRRAAARAAALIPAQLAQQELLDAVEEEQEAAVAGKKIKSSIKSASHRYAALQAQHGHHHQQDTYSFSHQHNPNHQDPHASVDAKVALVHASADSADFEQGLTAAGAAAASAGGVDHQGASRSPTAAVASLLKSPSEALKHQNDAELHSPQFQGLITPEWARAEAAEARGVRRISGGSVARKLDIEIDIDGSGGGNEEEFAFTVNGSQDQQQQRIESTPSLIAPLGPASVAGGLLYLEATCPGTALPLAVQQGGLVVPPPPPSSSLATGVYYPLTVTMTGMGAIPQYKTDGCTAGINTAHEDEEEGGLRKEGEVKENRRLTLSSSDVRMTLRALLENC